MTSPAPHGRLLAAFGVIVAAYWVFAIVFALTTHPWQAPDEPAHLNYVRDLASGRLPVQQPGDWNQAYLSQAVSSRFPPTISIDPIRYEGHQPPLYYAALTPAHLLTRDAPLEAQLETLRLMSALLVLPLLALTWQIARRVLSGPWLPLLVVAFVALLPQHLAISSAVNNDIAGELSVALLLLWGVVVVNRPGNGMLDRRLLVAGALAVAFTLVAKSTAYPSLALVPLALWLRPGAASAGVRLRRSLLDSVVVLGGGLALASPWFLRNMVEYGLFDPLGQARHDQIVVGQPGGRLDTLDGWLDFLTIGFRSFFLQLGWMALPAQDRVYWVLLVLLAASLAGLLGLAATRPGWTPGATLLTACLILTLGAVLYYNLRFFQPQGRYLFPALIPIATGLVAGAAAWAPARFRLVGPVVWLLALGVLNIIALTDLVPALQP